MRICKQVSAGKSEESRTYLFFNDSGTRLSVERENEGGSCRRMRMKKV